MRPGLDRFNGPRVERLFHEVEDLDDDERRGFFELLESRWHVRWIVLFDEERPWRDPRTGFGPKQVALLECLNGKESVAADELIRRIWADEIFFCNPPPDPLPRAAAPAQDGHQQPAAQTPLPLADRPREKKFLETRKNVKKCELPASHSGGHLLGSDLCFFGDSAVTLDKPLVDSLPPVAELRFRLGDALREVELLRGLLRLAEKAEQYRQRDAEISRSHEPSRN